MHIYDVFYYSIAGYREAGFDRNIPLPDLGISDRAEARNTNWDRHVKHWDGYGWRDGELPGKRHK